MRDVLIHPVLNGFVATVGCQQVVFLDIDTLAEALRAYVRDPRATERAFLKAPVNRTTNTPESIIYNPPPTTDCVLAAVMDSQPLEPAP